MEKVTTRRPLVFSNLDEVVQDADNLRNGGYQKVGTWNLAQVSGHLAEWMRFPIDGFPKAPLPIRVMLWAMRKASGRRELRRILESRSMRSGGPTLRETIPPDGGDEAQAVDRLRRAIGRFKAHTGPFHPSPLFGELTREEATRLQLIHCAHHLSFLIPTHRDGSG